PANELFVMIDKFRQSETCEPARIAPKFMDLTVHAGPVRSNDAVTFSGVVPEPVLPNERSYPQARNENNRRDVHRKYPRDRTSSWPGKISGGEQLNMARWLMSNGSCRYANCLTACFKAPAARSLWLGSAV